MTAGFKGDVGVVPRQFLREFVTRLDLVAEHDDYDPLKEYGFKPLELRPEEKHVISGEPLPPIDDDGAALIPTEDAW